MAFSHETIKEAIQIKNGEIKKREQAYYDLLNSVMLKNPRLSEIDKEISVLGTTAVKLSLAGKTEEIKELQKKNTALREEKANILKEENVIPFTCLCPVCGDTNYVNGFLCDCVKEIAKEISLTNFYKNIPQNDADFNTFKLSYYPIEAKEKMEKIFNFAKDYAENFSKVSGNVLFMGKCGLGKTHLSLSIAKTVIEKGYGVVYGSAQNLFSDAEKEHFSYSADTEKTDELLNCDLLIIDDLGTEFLNNFTTSLFYNIVNTRLLNKKSTVINTNLTFEELTARYTARITSRFIGEYTLKQFLGNDIRQLKAVEKLNKE